MGKAVIREQNVLEEFNAFLETHNVPSTLFKKFPVDINRLIAANVLRVLLQVNQPASVSYCYGNVVTLLVNDILKHCR